jgi:hypothetical protein
MLRGIVTVAAALVVSGSALAQPKHEINASAKAMIGPWEFSDAARSKVCTVTFSETAVKVGYKLAFAPECAALFPLVVNIVGWSYPDNDLLYLLDAQGKALVEFSEVEDGIFEAPTPGVGVLFLHNPAMAEPDNTENAPGSEVPLGGDNPPAGQPAAPQELPAPKGDGG